MNRVGWRTVKRRFGVSKKSEMGNYVFIHQATGLKYICLKKSLKIECITYVTY